jgi:hypothetical protein
MTTIKQKRRSDRMRHERISRNEPGDGFSTRIGSLLEMAA